MEYFSELFLGKDARGPRLPPLLAKKKEKIKENLPGQHARGPRPPPPLARPALARSLTQTGPLGALRKSARARARERESFVRSSLSLSLSLSLS